MRSAPVDTRHPDHSGVVCVESLNLAYANINHFQFVSGGRGILGSEYPLSVSIFGIKFQALRESDRFVLLLDAVTSLGGKIVCDVNSCHAVGLRVNSLEASDWTCKTRTAFGRAYCRVSVLAIFGAGKPSK